MFTHINSEACAASAFEEMTLVDRTLGTLIAGGGPGGGAVPGAVVVATLLDAAAVTDADRFALLGRCLTT